MTRRRFNLQPPAALLDRDGRQFGVVTSMTIDIDPDVGLTLLPPAAAMGDIGGKEGGEEQQTLEDPGFAGSEQTPAEGGRGDAVADVWAYWLEKRQPARKQMPEGINRMIRRALKAGFTVPDLKAAINGLLASDWHRERDLLTLSTIFATRPGGPVFEEQVDSWVARGADLPTVKEGTVSASVVEAAKRTVHETYGKTGVAAKELLVEAIKTLERHGITVAEGANGRPEFRAGGQR